MSFKHSNVSKVLFSVLLAGLIALGATLLSFEWYQSMLLGLWAGVSLWYILFSKEKVQAYTSNPLLRLLFLIFVPFTILANIMISFDYRLDHYVFISICVLAVVLSVADRYIRSKRNQFAIAIVASAVCLGTISWNASVCIITPCHAASWSEQVEFARRIANRHAPQSVLDRVYAFPRRPTPFWFGEYPDLFVVVLFSSTVPSTTEPLPYADSAVSFSDLDPQRTYEYRAGNSWGARAPEPLTQEIATRISLSPRDALRTTQVQAERILAHNNGRPNIYIHLHLADEIAARYHAPAVWEVVYTVLGTSDYTEIIYIVHADTGSVLSEEQRFLDNVNR